MSSMAGVIEARGTPLEVKHQKSERLCSWTIVPDVRLESIQITTRASFFDEQASDFIRIFGKNGEFLAQFSKDEPMPPKMKISHHDTGSVVIQLHSGSPETYFSLEYTCTKSQDVKVLWYHVAPAMLPWVWGTIIATLVLVKCLMTLVMFKWYKFDRDRREERENAKEEQRVAKELKELPSMSWRDTKVLYKDDDDVCSLCLDAYEEDDSLVVLPCKHYFHQECVSRWFSTKRQSKHPTCPKCRRNPIERKSSSGEGTSPNPAWSAAGDSNNAGNPPRVTGVPVRHYRIAVEPV